MKGYIKYLWIIVFLNMAVVYGQNTDISQNENTKHNTFKAEFQEVLKLYPKYTKAKGKLKTRLGLRLSLFGYHPLLTENIVFLPSGEKTKAASVVFYENGKIETVFPASSTKIHLPSGEKALMSPERYKAFGYFYNGSLSYGWIEKEIAVALPSGTKVKAKGYISYFQNGKLSSVSVSEDSPIILPNGKRVNANNTIFFYTNGQVSDADICEETAVILPSGDPALAEKGSLIAFYDNGSIAQIILAKDTPITFPNGEKVTVRAGDDYPLSFHTNGRIDRCSFALPLLFTLPNGDSLKVRSVSFYTNGILKDAMPAEESVMKLPTGEVIKLNTGERIEFFENGRLERIRFAESIITLPTGDKATVESIGYCMNGKPEYYRLTENATVTLASGQKTMASADYLMFSTNGKIKEIHFVDKMPIRLPSGDTVNAYFIATADDGWLYEVRLSETATVTLPSGVKAIAREGYPGLFFYQNGKIREVRLAQSASVVLPSGKQTTIASYIRYYENGIIEKIFLANDQTIAIPNGQLVPASAVEYYKNGSIARIDLAKQTLLRGDSWKIPVCNRILFYETGEIIKAW